MRPSDQGFFAFALLLVGCGSLSLPGRGEGDDALLRFSFNEGKGNVVHDSARGAVATIEEVLTTAKYQAPRMPEWKRGVQGASLAFDGYTTFLDLPAPRNLEESLTVSAWVAPRAFEWGDGGRLTTILTTRDYERPDGFTLGYYRHGTFSFQFGDGQGWNELWSQERRLEERQWNHVAATWNATSHEARLYLNGEQVASKVYGSETVLAWSQAKWSIGRNSSPKKAGVFDLGQLSGLLDELTVLNRAASEEEIAAWGAGAPALPWEDIRLDPAVIAADVHHPQIHVTAPRNWMNEPHAPFFYRGKYHLFYQHNPFGPYWHNIQWGHWVSDDLLHWKNLPPALVPEDDGVAPDGIWSGSATLDGNGNPVLFYTAGNDSKIPNQSVAEARPANLSDPQLVEWTKASYPSVEQGDLGLDGQFRDPFVWKEDESTWYMLVGSGLKGQGGTALVYRSHDLAEWEELGPLFTIDQEVNPQTGSVWELPVLLPVIGPNGQSKRVFLFNPWGPGSSAEIHYFVGSFDPKSGRFVPEHREARLIDLGGRIFTGPSGFVDPVSGQTLLFSIVQDDRQPWDQYFSGWAHVSGIPRVLSLDEAGRLRSDPLPAVSRLRKKLEVDLENVSLAQANAALQNLQSPLWDVELSLVPGGGRSGLSVRRDSEGLEHTDLYYEATKGTFSANRTASSLGRTSKSPAGGRIQLKDGLLKMRTIIDRSVITTFLADGRNLTTRVYPQETGTDGLALVGDGSEIVVSLKVWSLTPATEANLMK